MVQARKEARSRRAEPTKTARRSALLKRSAEHSSRRKSGTYSAAGCTMFLGAGAASPDRAAT
jgi:hypothetical protein